METVKITAFRLNKDNPRLIRDGKFRSLVESIKRDPEFLEKRGIVHADGVILGGNQRYLAIKEALRDDAFRSSLGLDKGLIPAAWVQDASDWPEEKRRRFVIVDNGAWGEWDMSALANAWDDLPLADFGIDLPEDWLAPPSPEGTADAEPQIDRAEELNKTWGVKTGDLWQIGEHRLLCGDSTKKEDVGRVMGEERAILMVTDPPYGIALDATWRDGVANRMGKAQKGKLNQDDGFEWMPALGLSSSDVAYVYHHHNFGSLIQSCLEDAGYQIKQQIVWVKTVHTLTMSHYQQKHEPCWYAVKKGVDAKWIGGRDQMSAFELASPKHIMGGSKEEKQAHPTQKPLEAFSIPIHNHDSEFVYDPFLGSGTTMVACQNLNRKCRGIEISPDYCAVILQRMFDAFPGIKIRRIE